MFDCGGRRGIRTPDFFLVSSFEGQNTATDGTKPHVRPLSTQRHVRVLPNFVPQRPTEPKGNAQTGALATRCFALAKSPETVGVAPAEPQQFVSE